MFDRFAFSESPALWIKDHFKGILAVMAVCALSGLGFIAWREWNERHNQKVRESLYRLKKSLHDLETNEKGEDTASSFDIFSESKKENPPAFTQEIKETAKRYAEHIRQYRNTKASVEFALDLADFYYRYNEKEKAKSLLAFFAQPEETAGIYHLAVFQLASYYTNKTECDKALALFRGLSRNKKATAFHLESALKEGLCLEITGQRDQALAKYEEILQKDPNSWTGRQAQDYRRILILERGIQKSGDTPPPLEGAQKAPSGAAKNGQNGSAN